MPRLETREGKLKLKEITETGEGQTELRLWGYQDWVR